MLRLSTVFVVFMLLGNGLYAQELGLPSTSMPEKPSGEDEKPLLKRTLGDSMPEQVPADPNATWRWHDRNTFIEAYFLHTPPNYEVRLVRKKGNDLGFKIQVFDGSDLLHEWTSVGGGGFVFHGTTVIYLHYYRSLPVPGELLAFDLAKRKQLWKTTLTGLKLPGPEERITSQHTNKIYMKIENNELVVYGNESDGQHIETIELGTGKTLTYTVGSKSGNRF